MRRGIAKDWIILEDKSVTTRENLSFIARNLPPGYNKIIIVTSDFHIRRALLIAELMGLSAYGLPSETPGNIVVNCYFREYFALLKTYLLDKVSPPAYLR